MISVYRNFLYLNRWRNELDRKASNWMRIDGMVVRANEDLRVTTMDKTDFACFATMNPLKRETFFSIFRCARLLFLASKCWWQNVSSINLIKLKINLSFYDRKKKAFEFSSLKNCGSCRTGELNKREKDLIVLFKHTLTRMCVHGKKVWPNGWAERKHKMKNKKFPYIVRERE